MSAPADTPQSAPTTPGTKRRGQSGRALHQRQRILDAAERCFIDSGFHAATMDHIARTANVSPGLIYRYFDSKSAIVRAIIERHLENDGCRLVDEHDQSQPLSERLLDVFECWRRGADPKLSAALMLELTAESTRNAELAEFIRGHDRLVGKSLAARVRREASSRGAQLTAADAHGRAVILQCLVEGLASRAVRDPTLRRQTLRSALEQVIAALLR
jgi:AcrR family transcriptional regulator